MPATTAETLSFVSRNVTVAPLVLLSVVDHYNRGGLANPYLDGGMQALGLTEPEIDELVAFLFTLTDRRYAHVNEAARAKQTAYKKQHRNERDTPAAADLGHVIDEASHGRLMRRLRRRDRFDLAQQRVQVQLVALGLIGRATHQ